MVGPVSAKQDEADGLRTLPDTLASALTSPTPLVKCVSNGHRWCLAIPLCVDRFLHNRGLQGGCIYLGVVRATCLGRESPEVSRPILPVALMPKPITSTGGPHPDLTVGDVDWLIVNNRIRFASDSAFAASRSLAIPTVPSRQTQPSTNCWCPWPAKPEINQPDGIQIPNFSGENEELDSVRTNIARRPGR